MTPETPPQPEPLDPVGDPLSVAILVGKMRLFADLVQADHPQLRGWASKIEEWADQVSTLGVARSASDTPREPSKHVARAVSDVLAKLYKDGGAEPPRTALTFEEVELALHALVSLGIAIGFAASLDEWLRAKLARVDFDYAEVHVGPEIRRFDPQSLAQWLATAAALRVTGERSDV